MKEAVFERIALAGFGAIGQAVFDSLRGEPALRIEQILVRHGREAATTQLMLSLDASSHAHVRDTLCLNDARPDLLVECAGHAAIEQHVLPALEEGIPCLVVSVGALSEPGLAERLEEAALKGRTQVHLLAGAIGGIDALAAARIAGLDKVVYVGRKPPLGWLGSPAEEKIDLHNIKEATKFFEGSAREAARLYPKNANVAATLSLSGIGLDDTKVQLWADPGVQDNIHYYEAEGVFGHMAVTLQGKPLASNPKTSTLTVYSVVRALKNRVHAVAI